MMYIIKRKETVSTQKGGNYHVSNKSNYIILSSKQFPGLIPLWNLTRFNSWLLDYR